jgi:hypothetical protein
MERMVDVVVSVLTGFALWALLPRGVVLTRSVRAADLLGNPKYDTWEILNNSALPIQVVHVRFTDPTADGIRMRDLPTFEGSGALGVSLTFDDATLEIRRSTSDRPWRGQVVPPGETLEAHLVNNRTMIIQYRREGWTGIFERRTLEIHGYT